MNFSTGFFLIIKICITLTLVILLSDGLFKNSESKLEVSRLGERVMCIPIDNSSCIATVMNIKASVGYPGSNVLHVIESAIEVPRFANMVPMRQDKVLIDRSLYSIPSISCTVDCQNSIYQNATRRSKIILFWKKDIFKQ